MAPRPRKPRRCSCPLRADGDLVFKPAGRPLKGLRHALLGRDELEALVLCDRDGLTQEQAGESMGVSRGTVQRLVASARRKVAGALAGPQALVVLAAGPEEAGDPSGGPWEEACSGTPTGRPGEGGG